MRALAPLVPVLLALTGCSAELQAPVEESTHALDCAADQVCPDGTPCPADGVCAEPGDGWADDCDARAAACANVGGDGPDPEACADWLAACFANGGDQGGDGGGGGAACGDLAADCWNGGAPDRAACGEWLQTCAPDALRDWVAGAGDADEAAARACDLLAQACGQGLDDACWLSDEVCQGDPAAVDPAAVREHACGLLDEVCASGMGEACEVATALGCGDAGGGAGGGGGGGGDGDGDGGECGALLTTCTDTFDRDACFDWFETCAPAEWRGEGEACATSLHACGDGDLASCQDWLQTCAPESVRQPGCIDVLTACYQGDHAACGDIQAECL